jgi:hypothetical protein
MHNILALMERLRFVRELIKPNNGTMQRRAWQQGGACCYPVLRIAVYELG